MPELPEVETIKMGLKKYLIGHRIVDMEVKDPRLFQGDKKNVIGSKVLDVQRVGKGLIILLDNNYSFGIHLKLTGQLVYRGHETENVNLSGKVIGGISPKFSFIIFKLDKDAVLYYNDMRRFGWIKVVKKDDIRNLPFFKEMGPEPLAKKLGSAQKDLTLQMFGKIVSSSNAPVKLLLMDQKRIGGVGNIYANEALFAAKIDPRRRAKTLTDKEIKKLYNAIIDVLEKGLKYGGASDVNFVNALGQDGRLQEHFLIYGRAGKPCMGCKGTVKRIALGGRGTFICEKCQK